MMDILCIAKKGTSKTQIMFKANLSFSQLNGYINFLVQHHFLEVIGSKSELIYKTTSKGLEFIEIQQQIIGMFTHSFFEGKLNPPIKYPIITHLIV